MKHFTLTSALALLLLSPSAARAQLDNFPEKQELTRRVEKLEAEVGRLRSELDRLTRSAQGEQTAPRASRSTSQAEARLAAQLDSPTELEFHESPFYDVVDYLSNLHDIPIMLDPRIKETGFKADSTTTLIARDITLRAALDLLLAPHDLDYVIDNEVLKITTSEIAGNFMVTKVYDARPLGDVPVDELARVIRSTIRPDSWRQITSPNYGGPATSSGFASGGEGGGGFGGGFGSGAPPTHVRYVKSAAIEPLGSFLVITQSQRGHREIATLLTELVRMQTSSSQQPRPQANSPDTSSTDGNLLPVPDDSGSN